MKKRKKQYKNRPYYVTFWRQLDSQVNALIFIMLWSMSSVSFANTVEYGISTYDLNKQPSLEPRQILEAVELGHNVFIVENHHALGNRLISLNSETQTELALVLDGVSQSQPDFSDLRIIEDTLYFFANDNNQLKHLWRFNNACSCAFKLAGEFEDISHVTVSGGELFFVAQTAKYGAELWQAELEQNRSTLVHDINIGPEGSKIDRIETSDNKLYFTATNRFGKRKVYQYFQDEKRLAQVSDFNSLLQQEQKFYKPHIAAVDGEHLIVELEFVTSRSSLGGQLWHYNLHTAEIAKIADLNHYSICYDDGSIPFHKKTSVTIIDNKVYYVSNEDLRGIHVWQYDITTGNRRNITAGVFEDVAPDISCWPWELRLNNLINFKGQLLFFVIQDYVRGRLWHFDAEQESLTQLEGYVNYSAIKLFDDNLYIPGQMQISGAPMHLWTLDAGSLSLIPILDDENRPLTEPAFYGVNGKMLFTSYAIDKGLRLWHLNRQRALNRLFVLNNNENTGSYPRKGIVTEEAYYFAADSGLSNRKIWRAGVTGTPQLLPFELPEELSHYQVSFDSAVSSKVFFTAGIIWQIDTETNSVTAVEAINDLSNPRLSFFKQQNDVLYYQRQFWQGSAPYFRVIKYHSATDQAERIYNGPGRLIDVTADSIYLQHDNDDEKGLFRFDLASQELQFLATTSPHQCSTVRHGAILESGNRTYSLQLNNELYLITGEGYLKRIDTTTQSVTDLGCAEDLFTDGEQVFLLRNRGQHYYSTLWRVEPGNNEILPVLDAQIRYYANIGSKLYYETIDAQSGTNLSVYHLDEHYNQWIAQRFNADTYSFVLRSIQQIGDNIYYFSRTRNPHYPAPSEPQFIYRIWRAGDEQPIKTFDGNEIWPALSQTSQFAGDIWFNADINQHGFYKRGELARLHIGTDYINQSKKLDFDGDNRADVAFHDSFGKVWRIYPSATEGHESYEFGEYSTDIPMTGDFDGDGLNDIALRIPDEHMWHVLNSGQSNFNSEQQDGVQRVRLGLQTDDYPVPADYDGDGITDFAVVRVSKGIWIIRQSTTSDIVEVKTGFKVGDIPVVGDFDGDGVADVAYRNRNEKRWYIYPSSKVVNGELAWQHIQSIRFGLDVDDIPVTGDYDGDGVTDLAVWRPTAGVWIIRNSQTSVITEEWFEDLDDALPLAADFDGDGRDDFALYSPEPSLFTVRNAATKINWYRTFSIDSGFTPVGLPAAMAFPW